MRKTYGVDLDGVTFKFKRGLGLYIEDVLGIPYNESEITSYYWHECIDELSREDFVRCFHEFGQSGGYRDLDPRPGAVEGIKKILSNGDIVRFITNRPTYAYRDTVECLVEHGLDRNTFLHFANGSKSPYIKKYNVDVFIDDSPHTIPDIVSNTRSQVYCMDHLFNRDLDDNDGEWFTRVWSFDEFLEEEGFSAKRQSKSV